MLPTILENEISPPYRDPNSALPKFSHKADPDMISSSEVYSRVSQNRQVTITEGVRAAQARKRGTNPPSSLQYYPTIRCNVLPHPKFAKSPNQAEQKPKGSPPSVKRNLKETQERIGETNKQVIKMAEVQANDIESPGGRRSLPYNSLSQSRQTPQQNSKSGARDILKAKYKARESQADNQNSVSGYQQNSTKLYEKGNAGNGEGLVNKSSYEGLADKKFLNSEKTKGHDSKANSCVLGEKTLLHSVSKESQKKINATLYTSIPTEEAEREEGKLPLKETYLKEMLIDALKKTSTVTPTHKKGKEDMYNPIIKLLLHKNDIRESGQSDKRENNRSPSLTSKLRNQRDATSISPSKKSRPSMNEKVNKDVKQEKSAIVVRKATPISVYLSDEEKTQYGDRNLSDYEKVELLGKGGFALVWLGICKSTGRKVAMKQMAKNSGGESKKNDLYYGQLLFKEGGEPREEFKKYPGIGNIARFIDYKSTKTDDWHISELCGKTLSSLLFDMKGEFCKGERVYGVKHLELHNQFRCDGHSFKTFIKSMAETLHLFSDYNIVHSDIKPENILMSMESGRSFSLKIIDFGSAYSWGDSGNIRMATPEYMPPEFLNILAGRNATENSIEKLAEISNPWSVDVWSLGAVLVEIITGIPLWIPLKCKLENKKNLKYGLFAAKGRAYDKIYLKQKALVENFQESLGEYLANWQNSESLYDLLGNMLMWDPKKRISPTDILKHSFLRPT